MFLGSSGYERLARLRLVALRRSLPSHSRRLFNHTTSPVAIVTAPRVTTSKRPPARGHCNGVTSTRIVAGMSLPWIALVVAGLLEVCWAVGLKYTDGFRRPVPSILVIVAIAASMFLLSWAARTLPIGTAYAIWVGIGAFGATILGIVLFDEPVTAARMGFLVLLLVAIVGLKMTSEA